MINVDMSHPLEPSVGDSPSFAVTRNACFGSWWKRSAESRSCDTSHRNYISFRSLTPTVTKRTNCSRTLKFSSATTSQVLLAKFKFHPLQIQRRRRFQPEAKVEHCDTWKSERQQITHEDRLMKFPPNHNTSRDNHRRISWVKNSSCRCESRISADRPRQLLWVCHTHSRVSSAWCIVAAPGCFLRTLQLQSQISGEA